MGPPPPPPPNCPLYPSIHICPSDFLTNPIHFSTLPLCECRYPGLNSSRLSPRALQHPSNILQLSQPTVRRESCPPKPKIHSIHSDKSVLIQHHPRPNQVTCHRPVSLGQPATLAHHQPNPLPFLRVASLFMPSSPNLLLFSLYRSGCRTASDNIRIRLAVRLAC